jgi:hypothetical protein
MLSGYERMIIEATGCSANDVQEIEEILRGVVFHSALDWLTEDELKHGARLAYAVCQRMNQVNRSSARASSVNLPRPRGRNG